MACSICIDNRCSSCSLRCLVKPHCDQTLVERARTCIVGALRVRGAGALGGVVEELRARLQHELELQQLRVAARDWMRV